MTEYDYRYFHSLNRGAYEDTDYKFQQYARRIGAYVGSFDFADSDVKVDDEITNKIITVGDDTYGRKSASTVEPGLKRLFPKSSDKPKQTKHTKKQLRSRERASAALKLTVRGEGELSLAPKLSDMVVGVDIRGRADGEGGANTMNTTDETDVAFDISEITGSFDADSTTQTTILGTDDSDYNLAREINGSAESADSSDSSDNDNDDNEDESEVEYYDTEGEQSEIVSEAELKLGEAEIIETTALEMHPVEELPVETTPTVATVTSTIEEIPRHEVTAAAESPAETFDIATIMCGGSNDITDESILNPIMDNIAEPTVVEIEHALGSSENSAAMDHFMY